MTVRQWWVDGLSVEQSAVLWQIVSDVLIVSAVVVILGGASRWRCSWFEEDTMWMRLSRRLHQAWCRVRHREHLSMLRCDPPRLYLSCAMCPAETAGWELVDRTGPFRHPPPKGSRRNTRRALRRRTR